MKKVAGIVFLIIALILTIAIPGQLSAIITIIFGVVSMFSGDTNAQNAAYALGGLAYWVFHGFVAFMFWKYGLKWVKTTTTVTKDTPFDVEKG